MALFFFSVVERGIVRILFIVFYEPTDVRPCLSGGWGGQWSKYLKNR